LPFPSLTAEVGAEVDPLEGENDEDEDEGAEIGQCFIECVSI